MLKYGNKIWYGIFIILFRPIVSYALSASLAFVINRLPVGWFRNVSIISVDAIVCRNDVDSSSKYWQFIDTDIYM